MKKYSVNYFSSNEDEEEYTMFIGRKTELNLLKETLSVPNQHTIVYGVRRVGKTTLIQTAAKQTDLLFVSFECIKASLKDNVKLLTDLLAINGLVSNGVYFDSFISLFQYINSLEKHIVLLIDEYPYLYEKENKNEVDSIFQNIIDNYSSNINIVLSGSHVGMMKTLLEASNPLYARFKSYIHLTEMDYLEASEFYRNKTNYEKVQFYSVFGGSPFILSQLDYNKSIKENIISTFLNPHSSIKLFLSDGFTSDDNIHSISKNIFRLIGNGKEKYTDLENKLGYEHNGLLSKQIKALSDMELIHKQSPINKLDNPRKTTYTLCSNSIRFYYSYVYGMDNQISVIGKENFYDLYIEKNITSFIAYRFEQQARDFVSKLVKKGVIKNVYNIGSYYYDDPISKTNGEFDIAIETSNSYTIFEVKYLINKVNKQIVNKEISQIKAIKGLQINKIGFISINGFDNDVDNLDYQFDGNDMYSI